MTNLNAHTRFRVRIKNNKAQNVLVIFDVKDFYQETRYLVVANKDTVFKEIFRGFTFKPTEINWHYQTTNFRSQEYNYSFQNDNKWDTVTATLEVF